MPYPPISALPAVPSRNAPSTFSALMDAFLAAFPTLRTEINALAAYLDTLALATGPGLFQNGSAAAPGVSWVLDTNTGLFRPAADQIGFATGGVQRALLSGSALQLDVPLTGLAVTQSTTDTTSGRAVKTGDAGILGATPTWSGSADSIPLGVVVSSGAVTEQQAIDNQWPTIAGAATTIHRWFVVECFGTTARATQIAVEVFGNGVGPKGRTYVRVKHDSTWSAWRLLYTQSTILGTVSQSAGMPTGALIEYGSNANGEYIRWADGTQVCIKLYSGLGPISTGLGSIFVSSSISLGAMPAAFSSLDCGRSFAIRYGGNSAWITSDGSSFWLNRSVSSALTDYSVVATFVGRWF